MNERYDELASAWLDGQLDDEERTAASADDTVRRASEELDRVRQALAEPIAPPVGLLDEHIARAMAALPPIPAAAAAAAAVEHTDPAAGPTAAHTDSSAAAGGVGGAKGPNAGADGGHPGRADAGAGASGGSGDGVVVPLRLRRVDRRRPSPWLARVATVGVLVGGIGLGTAAILDRDPAVQDGDVALVAESTDQAGSDAATTGPPAEGGFDASTDAGPAAGGDPGEDDGADPSSPDIDGTGPAGDASPAGDPDAGAEAEARLEGAEPAPFPGPGGASGDQPGPDGSAHGSSATGAGPPGSLTEEATSVRGSAALDPVALRDHLIERFGPVAGWPIDPGAPVQCADPAMAADGGRPPAVVPFERDGGRLELVVPASGEPFILVPPDCQRSG